MAEEPKKIIKQTFEGGRDSDTDDTLIPQNRFRRMLNMRIVQPGTRGKAKAVLGNNEIFVDLPDGQNKCIGKQVDEENNCFYWCNWNSNGYHTIYQYNDLTQNVSIILQSITDSGGIDILRWSNLKAYRINHIDIINGNLFTWCNGLNKAGKFNIKKAIDKTAAGYGQIIFEDFIVAYKQTSVYAPKAVYTTDTSRNSNNLYGNLFKFAIRWYYDDGERSNYSDWSTVPKPLNEAYTGLNTITFDNNCIPVTVATGNQLVKKIEIAFQSDTTNDGVLNSNFYICAVLDKSELQIGDNSNYVYNFYNDGSYVIANQDLINRNYSYLPRIPFDQAFVKSAMTYTNFDEGWPIVHPQIGITLRLDDLFLPPDTENKLSAAQLIVQKLNDDYSGGYHRTQYGFTIGVEVKKGVKYEVFGDDAKSHYYFSYIATATDDASSVASYIASWLTGIGRSAQSPPIQGMTVNMDGSVFFNYRYLGAWHESYTIFRGNVTQVSYVSLMDNGTSLQIIPYGSITNYAVVYIDDDGRESLAYSTALSVIRTPYVTETGSYKLPVHVVSINNIPPPQAKYWKLVRTPQPHGIEMLIQKVTPVDTDNTSDYLDLVVGSLLTYQKLHPNTILSYEFKKGDRLRLIKNCDTDVLYSGYFETEILSYTLDEEIPVKANIATHNSDLVTPYDGAKSYYVGKNIIINGTERTIIGIASPNYQLNAVIGFFNDTTDEIWPSYTIVDRRGIIRIKKLQGVTIVDNTQVELFTPQALDISDEYRKYYDCGNKYEVIGYGTDTPYHAAPKQNQTSSQPAILEINTGDAYIRDRELPLNNSVPGTQVVVSRVVDPNYSDFYYSALTDLGRVYPLDNGLGIVHFGSRTRFSGNYIVDTDVNGLSDFNNLDRVDNNDQYGDILLTKYLNNRLYAFKPLKDCYIPVLHTLSTGTDGNIIQVQTNKLLNQMQYFAYEGGIGNNPESWFVWTNWQYHASTTSGAFVRIGGEGVEAISLLYNFDFEAKQILSAVDKYDLEIVGDFDEKNGEALWSYLPYTEYLIQTEFNPGQWQVFYAPLADNIIYEVTQQPANGSVTYDSDLKQFVIIGTELGDDYFLYRPVLGGGQYGDVKKQCITTVPIPNRQTGYRVKDSTGFCLIEYGNSEITQDFTKEGCSEHYHGSVVPYTVAANTYYANTQEDADALAQNDVDTNGQTYANDNGTCISDTEYFNVRASEVFTKEGCPTGFTGSPVEYVVDAGTYSSFISQEDADAQAQADIDANGQDYANTNGYCIDNTSVNILTVDIFGNNTIDCIGYCDTLGTMRYQDFVNRNGNNFLDAMDAPATAFALASDRISQTPLKLRFEFNVGKYVAYDPSVTSLDFVIQGRASSSGTITGSYVLKNPEQGRMTMQGSPGTYIPSVDNPSYDGIVDYTTSIGGGADGTMNLATGAIFIRLTYDVIAKTITFATS